MTTTATSVRSEVTASTHQPQATGLAIVLSILIYYGQYIPSMIERTLPYMVSVFTRGPQSVGVERPPFGQYLLGYIPHLDYHIWPGAYLYYGIVIPLIFAGQIPGNEIEHPMAVVIFGGLITATLLNLFIVPALYLRWGRGSGGPAATPEMVPA